MKALVISDQPIPESLKEFFDSHGEVKHSGFKDFFSVPEGPGNIDIIFLKWIDNLSFRKFFKDLIPQSRCPVILFTPFSEQLGDERKSFKEFFIYQSPHFSGWVDTSYDSDLFENSYKDLIFKAIDEKRDLAFLRQDIYRLDKMIQSELEDIEGLESEILKTELNRGPETNALKIQSRYIAGPGAGVDFFDYISTSESIYFFQVALKSFEHTYRLYLYISEWRKHLGSHEKTIEELFSYITPKLFSKDLDLDSFLVLKINHLSGVVEGLNFGESLMKTSETIQKINQVEYGLKSCLFKKTLGYGESYWFGSQGLVKQLTQNHIDVDLLDFSKQQEKMDAHEILHELHYRALSGQGQSDFDFCLTIIKREER